MGLIQQRISVHFTHCNVTPFYDHSSLYLEKLSLTADGCAILAMMQQRVIMLTSSALAALLGGALATAPPGPPYPHTGPLTCQANDKFPMLPTFHIIGNVTQATDGAISLEPINDCSGVTFYKGIYHVWHQCCQNHWDHVGDTVSLPFAGRYGLNVPDDHLCLRCAGDQQGPDPLAASAPADPILSRRSRSLGSHRGSDL
jgi:hypothetical protein